MREITQSFRWIILKYVCHRNANLYKFVALRLIKHLIHIYNKIKVIILIETFSFFWRDIALRVFFLFLYFITSSYYLSMWRDNILDAHLIIFILPRPV